MWEIILKVCVGKYFKLENEVWGPIFENFHFYVQYKYKNIKKLFPHFILRKCGNIILKSHIWSNKDIDDWNMFILILFTGVKEWKKSLYRAVDGATNKEERDRLVEIEEKTFSLIKDLLSTDGSPWTHDETINKEADMKVAATIRFRIH